ncbi:hypothetical protein OL548_22340 [Lysinibacillus sp. MHQ-1]|nr:hypothetical protein OL548_22340 [Lysinibacillus sp. MHQ-1]
MTQELIVWIKNEQKKVFLDIVQQLRQLIKMKKTQAGEKEPSE